MLNFFLFLLIIFLITLAVELAPIFKRPKRTRKPPSSSDTVYSPLDSTKFNKYLVDEFRIYKYHYLNSSPWKQLRKSVLERDNYCCVICKSTYDLNVHHLSYKNLGNEPISDLVTLCSSCHTDRHEILGIPQTVEEYMNFNDIIV